MLLRVSARSGLRSSTGPAKQPTGTFIGEQLLGFAPDRFLYNAGLLTGVRFPLILDLPDVQHIAQQTLKAGLSEPPSRMRRVGFRCPAFVPPASRLHSSQDLIHRAVLQVQRENGAHALCFLPVDDQAA